MPDCEPFVRPIEDTVKVGVPALLNVAEQVFTPWSPGRKVYGPGRLAPPSVLLKVTVPVKAVSTLPAGSRAVTVNVLAVPMGRNREKPASSSREAIPVSAGRT